MSAASEAPLEPTEPLSVVLIAMGSSDRRLLDAARTVFAGEAVTATVLQADLSESDKLVLTGTDGLSVSPILAEINADHLILLTGGSSNDNAVDDLTGELTLLNEVLRQTATLTMPLWLLTRGGARGIAGDVAEDAVQAGLWGYGRVAANEYPERPMTLVDLSPTLSASEAAVRLHDLIVTPRHEREIIVDADGVWGLRARRDLPQRAGLEANAEHQAAETMMTLALEKQGSLESLRWQRQSRPSIAPGDVEIEVAATGLNFRDVMWAQGLLPAEALEDGFAGPTLGMECAGRICRKGDDVKELQIGDPVLAFAPACFASHVVVPGKAVAKIPDTVNIEEAATIPVAFLTTYYALIELARLQEEETILIHGGAGGVGLAALQIAKWRGAKIIATAGNPSKRALLTMLGADHVLDSRSLAFEDEVRALTHGAGVDCVLNSLFGDAMERSIGLLKPFGRFLELGKRDYYANTSIGLRPFRQNLSYFGIDADQLLTFQPRLAERLLKELMELFGDGTLTPLPHRRFGADQITDAFRLMQKSGHIGKIVVGRPALQAAAKRLDLPVSADKTYLLAGGLGGFGIETARWLISHGARHIVLTSRRGISTPEQEDAISSLRQLGASVEGAACDITDETAVNALIKKINSTSARLGGVLHTAMVLDDGLIENLDRDRIRKVLAPKVQGADVLDRATRGLKLDLFVLFSSATTLVGNPGQANYVAANMYLEALARARRRAGEQALAVAWGAIADAGYLARNQEVDAVLSQRLGRSSLSAKEALDGLEHLLTHTTDDPRDAAIVFARIDWSSVRKELGLFKTPLFSEIANAMDDQGDSSSEAGDISELLAGLSPEDATIALADVLAGEIGRILRMAPEELARHRPLTEIGMDSLMALELRMAAEERLGIDIPLMSLSGGVTLNDLSAKIVARHKSDAENNLSQEAATLAVQHVDERMQDTEDLAKIARAVEDRAGTLKDVFR